MICRGLFQLAGVFSPRGDTIPIPVTTTFLLTYTTPRIDVEDLTGDTGVLGQLEDYAAEIIDVRALAGHVLRDDFFLVLGGKGSGHVRLVKAGEYGIHRNVEAPQFLRGGFGERDQPIGLGGGIVRVSKSRA